MNKHLFHDFGVVDARGDVFEFHYGAGQDALCRLEAVAQTERGPKRTELAAIPVALWRKVSVRTVRELALGMDETERMRKAPTMKTGSNRLSPLLGRELAVLLWALMEDDAKEHVEAILHGWRELAREERWWLFAKGSAPGQCTGLGWRRALYHGLSEPADSRAAEADNTQKKSLQHAPPISPQINLAGRKRQVPQTGTKLALAKPQLRIKLPRKASNQTVVAKQVKSAARKTTTSN